MGLASGLRGQPRCIAAAPSGLFADPHTYAAGKAEISFEDLVAAMASGYGAEEPGPCMDLGRQWPLNIIGGVDGVSSERLWLARDALKRSAYPEARNQAETGLRDLSGSTAGAPELKARILDVLGSVTRDQGRLEESIAFYSRGLELARAVGAPETAAACATGRVVAAQVGADRSVGATREAWLARSCRYVDFAAAPVFESRDPTFRIDLSHQISLFYHACGMSELAQVEARANVLPAAVDLEDRGLLTAYILATVEFLIAADPFGNAPLIERYLEEALTLSREFSQPLRHMQHAVTRGLAYLAFRELGPAESHLAAAGRILDRGGFDNQQYRFGVRLLNALA